MTATPPIYVVNLDRSVERLRRFHEINPHLEQVTRFSAVDGAAVDRNALMASGHIGADVPYGPGTLGCALSHIRLWEMAAAEERSITVFEDDVVARRGFHARAQSVLADLADWDFVHWGCTLNPLYAWVDLGVTKVRLEGYGGRRHDSAEELGEFQAEDHRPAAVKLLHCFGAQGYSISPRGARAALGFCLPLRRKLIEFPEAGVRTWNEGIDTDLCGVFPSISAFLCIPALVMQGLCESERQVIDKQGGAVTADQEGSALD